MLDDGSGLGRRTAVRRTSAERAAIVAESYEPGATVARVARVARETRVTETRTPMIRATQRLVHSLEHQWERRFA